MRAGEDWFPQNQSSTARVSNRNTRAVFFEGVALMKKSILLICSLACITLVAPAILYPLYRQERMRARLANEVLAQREAARLEREKLLALLEKASTAKTKAEAMKKIVVAGADSGIERLIKYAHNDPLAAFDRKHSVAVVIDDSTGDVHVVTPITGTSRSFQMGSDPSIYFEEVIIFEEVKLLRSNEQQVDFVLKSRSPDPDIEYHWITFLVNNGLFNETKYHDVVSPDEISRWKSEKLWPF